MKLVTIFLLACLVAFFTAISWLNSRPAQGKATFIEPHHCPETGSMMLWRGPVSTNKPAEPNICVVMPMKKVNS